MLTHTPSRLRVLTLTGALTALFHIGCVAPTDVGTQGNPLSTAGHAHAMAFHEAPDQETLHVVISTFALACNNPHLGAGASDGTCPVGWTVNFALPAAAQVPGVYSLSDPAFQSNASEALGGDGNGGCVGGGGGAIEGTKVEVVSIDANHIKVRLSGFDSDGDIPTADGDYDVLRCK